MNDFEKRNDELLQKLVTTEGQNKTMQKDINALLVLVQQLQEAKNLLNGDKENLIAKVANLDRLIKTNEEELEHVKADANQLSQKLNETEGLNKILQTENKNLLEVLQELQETKNCLIKQIENTRLEMAQLMSQMQQTRVENDMIVLDLYKLEENERNQTPIAQMAHVQSLNEKKQELIENLRAALQSCLTNRDILNADNENLIAEAARLNALMNTSKAEVESLRVALKSHEAIEMVQKDQIAERRERRASENLREESLFEITPGEQNKESLLMIRLEGQCEEAILEIKRLQKTGKGILENRSEEHTVESLLDTKPEQETEESFLEFIPEELANECLKENRPKEHIEESLLEIIEPVEQAEESFLEIRTEEDTKKRLMQMTQSAHSPAVVFWTRRLWVHLPKYAIKAFCLLIPTFILYTNLILGSSYKCSGHRPF